jgi:hypothetical protein
MIIKIGKQKQPKKGDLREVKKFALFPAKCKAIFSQEYVWVWLEYYTQVQIYEARDRIVNGGARAMVTHWWPKKNLYAEKK